MKESLILNPAEDVTKTDVIEGITLDKKDKKEIEPSQDLQERLATILTETFLKFKRLSGGTFFRSILSGLTGAIVASTTIESVKIRTMIESHMNKVSEVEVEDGAGGENSKHKEYKHEDAETTHIINALCGKEHFSEKEKKDIAVAVTVKACRDYKAPIPEGIKSWQLEDIKNFYIKIESDAGIYPDGLDDLLNGPVYLSELYSTVWEQEKKAGSPYLRWSTTENTSEIGDAHNRAYYVKQTHTMYIKPEALSPVNMTDQYVAELSHALQFNEKPAESELKNLRDNLMVWIIAQGTGKDFKSVYDRILYEKSGTLENDAHYIIEPKIQAEVDKAKAKAKDLEKDSKDHYVSGFETHVTYTYEDPDHKPTLQQ